MKGGYASSTLKIPLIIVEESHVKSNVVTVMSENFQ